MDFNPSQRQAIETIHNHVCLFAGAGTGKTAVLIARILHILEEGYDPSQILAITFTEKATTEMRERLDRALQGTPYEGRGSEVHVSTFHSFCKSLIKQYAPREGEWGILDDIEATALLTQCARETLAARRFTREEMLLLGQVWPLTMDSMTSRLVQFALTKERYHLEEVVIPEGKEAPNGAQTLMRAYEEFATPLRGNTKPKKFLNSEAYQQALRMAKEVDEEGKSPQELLRILDDTVTSTMKAKPGFEAVKEARTALALAEEGKNLPLYRLLLGLLQELEELYARRKETLEVIDFDDHMKLGRRLMKDPNICQIYKERLRFIMVDEFQDTDPVQSEILSRIAGLDGTPSPVKLFIVGDPKQSIYRFRGSDIASFHEMVNLLRTHDATMISMQENYRCGAEILQCVNDAFTPIMTDYEALVPTRSEKTTVTQLALEKGEEISLINALGSLHDDGAAWEEMGILFRSGDPMAEVEKRLLAAGIPVWNGKSGGLGASRALQMMTLITEAFLYGHHRGKGLALLAAPWMGMSFPGLEVLAKLPRREWNPSLLSHEDGKILAECLGNLERMRQRQHLPFGMQVAEIVEDFRCWDVLDSSQESAAMERLLSEAEALQKSKTATWESWRDALNVLKQERKALTEGEGVQLLTIHGAKGLEFPHVFLYNSHKLSSGKTPKVNLSRQGVLGVNVEGRNGQHLLNLEEDQVGELEEEMRVHYVAMTRARDALVFLHEEGAQVKSHSLLDIAGEFPEISPTPWSGREEKTLQEEKREELASSPRRLKRKTYSYTHLQGLGTTLEEEASHFAKASLGLRSGLREEFYDLDVKERGSARFGVKMHKMISLLLRGRQLEDFQELSSRERSHLTWLQGVLPKDAKVLSEYPFVMNLEEFSIEGGIDAVFLTDEGITLWDFKAGNPREDSPLMEAKKRRYHDQLALYAMAAEEIFEKPILGARLCWYTQGILEEVDVSKSVQEHLSSSLLEHLRRVESSEYVLTMEEILQEGLAKASI